MSQLYRPPSLLPHLILHGRLPLLPLHDVENARLLCDLVLLQVIELKGLILLLLTVFLDHVLIGSWYQRDK